MSRALPTALTALAIVAACDAPSRSESDRTWREVPSDEDELARGAQAEDAQEVCRPSSAHRWREDGPELPPRRGGPGTSVRLGRAGRAHVALDASAIADRSFRELLRRASPQALVVDVWLRPRGVGEPVGLGHHACCVLHDAWLDSFRVWGTRGGAAPGTGSMDQVIDACLRPTDVRVPVGAGLTRGERVEVGALIRLNPRTAASERRIREWLARPGGSSPETLYGSSVSRLVGSVGQPERAFRLDVVRTVHAPHPNPR